MKTPTLPVRRPATRALAWVLRLLYVPLLLLGFNGLALRLIATGASHAWLLVLLLGAVALSFVVERLIPYDAGWNHSRGDAGRDWAHALVNELANAASLAALPLLAAYVTLLDVWPHHWPFAVQVLGAVLAFDVGVTLAHWASHRVPLLWRFHAVHHSVKRFYGFNGLMKHPVHQAVEMVAGVAPLLLVGLPLDVATGLAFCTAVQLLLQHSNADYRVGPLARVLALSPGHRFHHLQWAGVGDVNFGLFTHLVDYALGTFRYDAAQRVRSEDLGIGAEPDYPTGYVPQLLRPFRHRPEAGA